MRPQDRARALRPLIEQAAKSLDDKTASEGVELFRVMKYDGTLIAVNTRINWHGKLKRAAVDLYDTELNNPDNAPTLWETVMYRDGIRVIPEYIPATDPFAKGERGWWGNDLYESNVDANVYTPKQYPPNWTLCSV